MIKHLNLILSLFILLFIWNSCLANNFTVNFKGNLQTLGCKLSEDAQNKIISLSILRLSSLENQGHSDIYPFKLDIIDCPAMALNKTIKITLSSENIENHNGINYLQTTGDSNILLALTDSKGQELKFNTPIDIGTITHSDKGSVNTLSFGVYAQKPFDTSLNTGDFSSLVTFSLNYQ